MRTHDNRFCTAYVTDPGVCPVQKPHVKTSTWVRTLVIACWPVIFVTAVICVNRGFNIENIKIMSLLAIPSLYVALLIILKLYLRKLISAFRGNSKLRGHLSVNFDQQVFLFNSRLGNITISFQDLLAANASIVEISPQVEVQATSLYIVDRSGKYLPKDVKISATFEYPDDLILVKRLLDYGFTVNSWRLEERLKEDNVIDTGYPIIHTITEI